MTTFAQTLDYTFVPGGNRTGNGCGDHFAIVVKDTSGPDQLVQAGYLTKGELAAGFRSASAETGIPIAADVVAEFEKLGL